MGNQVLKCCYNCMKIQPSQLIPQTHFFQLLSQSSTTKSNFIKCKKYFISSQPLSSYTYINELILFTDKTLSIKIPNTNSRIRFKQDQIQKIQQCLKYQMENNNLVVNVKENCFQLDLNAIQEEEEDSQYAEFKQFNQGNQEEINNNENKQSYQNQIISENQLKKFKQFDDQDVYSQTNKENININKISNNNKVDKLNSSKSFISMSRNNKNKSILNQSITQNSNTNLNNTNPNNNNLRTQPIAPSVPPTPVTQLQSFPIRHQSRAFRFKNPLNSYNIQHIIVSIIPVFEHKSDLKLLKQSIQQSLSMIEDLKTIAICQLSYLLGYQNIIIQKIILQYLLGYSKSRKDYVFKRINELVYVSQNNQNIKNFDELLNVYTKGEKAVKKHVETNVNHKNNEKYINVNTINSGNNVNNNLNINTQRQYYNRQQIFKQSNKQNILKKHIKTQNNLQQQQNINNRIDQSQQNIMNQSSFHNLNQSFYSFIQPARVIVKKKQQKNTNITNNNNISNMNPATNNNITNPNPADSRNKHPSTNTNPNPTGSQHIPHNQSTYSNPKNNNNNNNNKFSLSNVSDITNKYQVSSIQLDNSDINNVRLRSFRSKQSNISDYF